jgi:hypothetical protein
MEMRFAGRSGRIERRLIHEGDHQHFAAGGVLRDGGQQASRVELRHEFGALLTRVKRFGDFGNCPIPFQKRQPRAALGRFVAR